jgi:hypothetical protein
VVTNVIAGLALVLAALSLFLQWRTSRAKLRISVVQGEASLPARQDSFGQVICELLPAVTVEMTNRSQKPVHVVSAELTVPGAAPLTLRAFNRLYDVVKPKPVTIEPLRGHCLAMDSEKLVWVLREEGFSGRLSPRVAVLDEAGRTHRSRRFRLSV